MLAECGKVNENTPVVTTVHDVQVVDDEIPVAPYDLPVDLIVTPTRVIKTERTIPKPRGIYWDLLPREKLEAIPVLKELMQRVRKR